VLPVFRPESANVALPAPAATVTGDAVAVLATVTSPIAKPTDAPSAKGAPASLDVIVTFFSVPMMRSSAKPFWVATTSEEASDGVTSALAGTANPLTIRNAEIVAAITRAANERYEEGVTNKLSMGLK